MSGLYSKEEDILLSTAVLARSVRSINCRMLLEGLCLQHLFSIVVCPSTVTCFFAFVEFVLFALRNSSANGSASMKDVIICRIDHLNEDVRILLQHYHITCLYMACVLQVCQASLQLFDCLLQADVGLVLQELTNCPSLATNNIVPSDSLHSIRLKLEEDTLAYLSLVPDSLCSNTSVTGESGLEGYLCDAHAQVKQASVWS